MNDCCDAEYHVCDWGASFKCELPQGHTGLHSCSWDDSEAVWFKDECIGQRLIHINMTWITGALNDGA